MEIRVCNLLKLERDGRENCLTLKGLSAFIFAKIKKKKTCCAVYSLCHRHQSDESFYVIDSPWTHNSR